MVEFYEPSEEGAAKLAEKEAKYSKVWKYDEHLTTIPVGKMFGIAISEMAESSLRPIISRKAKVLKRKFTIIVHPNAPNPYYEILRLPDPVSVGKGQSMGQDVGQTMRQPVSSVPNQDWRQPVGAVQDNYFPSVPPGQPQTEILNGEPPQGRPLGPWERRKLEDEGR